MRHPLGRFVLSLIVALVARGMGSPTWVPIPLGLVVLMLTMIVDRLEAIHHIVCMEALRRRDAGKST